MKKIISFFTLFLGGSLLLFTLSLLGCDTTNYKFIYQGFKANIFETTFGSPKKSIETNDTCLYNNNFITLELDMQIIVHNTLEGLGNKALALQVPEDSYTNLEPITDIKVISLFNYNGKINAGNEISEKCFYNNRPSAASEIDDSKEDLISRLNGSMNNEWEYYADQLNIKIAEPPTVLSLQQFAIEIRLGENSLLRDTTVAIVLKP